MPPISSFTINGLFNQINIHIPFTTTTKILIGENGVGKTQALNIFYYIITKNFSRLSEFVFDTIVINFSNSKTITITKKDIDDVLAEIYNQPIVKDIIDDIGYTQFENLRRKFTQSKMSRRQIELDMEYNSKFRKYPFHQVYRAIERIEMEKSNKQENLFSESNINSWNLTIDDSLSDWDILYFPTYRRVEEDLHTLGYNGDDELNNEQTLIQFGMDDVQKRFNEIEGQIDKYLKDGFSQITSEILSQLVRGFTSVDHSFLSRIDTFDIEIILARVGNKLSDYDKNEIRNIIKNNETKNASLTYFLSKLLEIYEKQKTIDNSVKLFRDTCNKYLVNKEVYYDESAIKIYVKPKGKNKNEIKLNRLSSGEKQIVSILSKVYLTDSNKKFIVLFDEPELSLGISWQKELLPDIINSKRCDFLLAVTHSPFIFDNSLDEFAFGLNEYITKIEAEIE